MAYSAFKMSPQKMLPAALSRAIAVRQGGRVVLVLGAGCSHESPTRLPLARQLSLEAHRQLLTDGVLEAGVCADPEDLSSLADAVVIATGDQTALVETLNPNRFRNAETNKGYLLAAALLRERAIACIMTLNFDFACASALIQIGGRDDVAIIDGPGDHIRLGLVNIIFLHRSAFSPPEEWIMTSEALETQWRDHWQDVVAQRVLSSPVIVFAGLGTPARVLIDTVLKIRSAIPGGAEVYQVDPGDPESSAFFSKLGIAKGAYVQLGWNDFMDQLGARVVEEHRAELERRCDAITVTEHFQVERHQNTCARLCSLGLFDTGRLRARWLLDDTAYLPFTSVDVDWLSDLILGISLIERVTKSEASFDSDGIVEFLRGARISGVIVVATGRGVRSWLATEAQISAWSRRFERRTNRPLAALVGGVQGGRPANVSPPEDIVAQGDPTGLMPASSALPLLTLTEIRDDPQRAMVLVPV